MTVIRSIADMVRFLNRFRTKSAECVEVLPNRLNLYKYSTKSAYSIEVEPNQQEMEDQKKVESPESVSYTHLTLPTNREV